MNREQIIRHLRMAEEILSKNMSKGDIILLVSLLQSSFAEIVVTYGRIVHGETKRLVVEELEAGYADSPTT